MIPSPSPLTRISLALLLMSGMPAMALAAESPPAPTPADAGTDGLQLDYTLFLADSVTRAAPPAFLLWAPDPPPGLQLQLIPFRILPGAKVKPSSCPAMPLGAKFAGWYIPPCQGPWPKGMPELPVGAPRLTREMEVADGNVSWTLARNFTGFRLSDPPRGPGTLPPADQVYAFLIENDHLKALDPGTYKRPERPAAEKPADFNARVKAEQEAHQAKVKAYREFSDKVRKLPTEFKSPAPKWVYAVCFAPIAPKRITWSGPAIGTASLEYSLDQWNALTILGGGPTVDAAKPDVERIAKLELLLAMKQQSSASTRLLAAALAASKLFNAAPMPDSVVYKTVVSMLEAGDPQILEMLTRSFESMPDSMRKADFLTRAAKAYAVAGVPARSGELKTLALRAAIHAPENIEPGACVRAVFTVIHDVDGAKPSEAFVELVQLLEPAALTTSPQNQNKPLLLAEVNGWYKDCSLEGVSDVRRQDLIGCLVELAPCSLLASQALDLIVLRPGNPADVPFALQRAVAVSKATPARTLPITSESHGLLALMASPNAGLHDAVFSSLAAFKCRTEPLYPVPAGPPAPKTQEISAADLTKILDRVVGLAKAQRAADRPMAPELVAFVCTHVSSPGLPAEPATAALFQLLVAADAKAAGQIIARLRQLEGAAVEIMGSGLAHLTPAETHICVAKFYADHGGLPLPIPAGFLLQASESGALATYFSKAFSTGHYPTGEEWAIQCPNATQLIDHVMNEDRRIAEAAVACLAYRAGGGEAGVDSAIKRVLSRTYKTHGMVAAAWESASAQIFCEQIKSRDGTYTLRVSAFNPDDNQWATHEAGSVTTTLKDDHSVATPIEGLFFKAATDRVAMTLEQVTRIDRLNPKTRSTLMLGNLSGQAVFEWKDGRWLAQTSVEDAQGRRDVKLELIPPGWQPPAPKAEPVKPAPAAKPEDPAKAGQVGGALEGGSLGDRVKRGLSDGETKGKDADAPPKKPGQ